MKMKSKLEVGSWNADEGFAVSPQQSGGSAVKRFSAACSAMCREMFHSLKEKVSSELAWRFSGVRPSLFRQAVNEAAALAATTDFPALFLPALAEEKVFLASKWERRQRAIQERTWLRAA